MSVPKNFTVILCCQCRTQHTCIQGPERTGYYEDLCNRCAHSRTHTHTHTHTVSFLSSGIVKRKFVVVTQVRNRKYQNPCCSSVCVCLRTTQPLHSSRLVATVWCDCDDLYKGTPQRGTGPREWEKRRNKEVDDA